MQFKEQHNAWVSYMKSQANTHGPQIDAALIIPVTAWQAPVRVARVCVCVCVCVCGCPNLMINLSFIKQTLLLNKWLRVPKKNHRNAPDMHM